MAATLNRLIAAVRSDDAKVARTELTGLRQEIDHVEEMDGPAPQEVLDYALTYPADALRAAVRTTKREIRQLIDQRLVRLAEPGRDTP